MAGYIVVNSENEFSMSSVFFDAIVNYSKIYLEEISPELAKEIYEPIEEAGMFVVGLTESTTNEFKLIFKALKKGYDNCISEGSCGNLDHSLYTGVMDTWKSILLSMEEDERNKVE